MICSSLWALQGFKIFSSWIPARISNKWRFRSCQATSARLSTWRERKALYNSRTKRMCACAVYICLRACIYVCTHSIEESTWEDWSHKNEISVKVARARPCANANDILKTRTASVLSQESQLWHVGKPLVQTHPSSLSPPHKSVFWRPGERLDSKLFSLQRTNHVRHRLSEGKLQVQRSALVRC